MKMDDELLLKVYDASVDETLFLTVEEFLRRYGF
jgi:hypothetical protein